MLVSMRQTYGNDHPFTLDTMAGLAVAHNALFTNFPAFRHVSTGEPSGRLSLELSEGRDRTNVLGRGSFGIQSGLVSA